MTVTGRLARRIRFRYGQWRRAANASVWRRPAVMSWQEWARQLWEDSLLRGGKAGEFTLLSSHGSLMLWEQALGRNAVAGFDLEQNAELARRSWNLALEYGLNLERLRSEVDGEDERRFARWVARFEELCRSGSWLEPAGLPPLLTQDHAKRCDRRSRAAVSARLQRSATRALASPVAGDRTLRWYLRGEGPAQQRGRQTSVRSSTRMATRNCRPRQAGPSKATPVWYLSISPIVPPGRAKRIAGPDAAGLADARVPSGRSAEFRRSATARYM